MLKQYIVQPNFRIGVPLYCFLMTVLYYILYIQHYPKLRFRITLVVLVMANWYNVYIYRIHVYTVVNIWSASKNFPKLSKHKNGCCWAALRTVLIWFKCYSFNCPKSTIQKYALNLYYILGKTWMKYDPGTTSQFQVIDVTGHVMGDWKEDSTFVLLQAETLDISHTNHVKFLRSLKSSTVRGATDGGLSSAHSAARTNCSVFVIKSLYRTAAKNTTAYVDVGVIV